ncbi:MAG: CoB--CoM heterodisulfide reductase iron-sulfur subunit A family protein [Candidatus Sumerlaeia bacterium]|nr:CoB--CoM heterodisulfide reductase iron-sulfur subunit A family protein [Candidatus Sumerlaeia bacterium]
MSQDNGKSRSKAILVLGGGISGITTAVELAELGYEVYLAEQAASLGGRVALMNKYFPKLCPPACGLEINYQRIRKAHDKIKVLTLAKTVAISGQVGAFEATLDIQPRHVNEKCTACDDCAKVCPVERASENDYGMGKTKAIYLPHTMALPMRYVIDMKACKGKECAKCVEACKYGAIDLDMKSTRLTLNVGAIVVATGWVPNDASRITNLGFGTCANVITNVMMERLAAPNGPTQGKILRPSDGKPVQTAVFVQCAGSRDENHLPYCSSVCCLASLKQANYLREQNPESKAYVFYIDLRAGGIFEDFLTRMQSDPAIMVQKGKVAKVQEDPATRDLHIEVEDILGGGKLRMRADLVVLATGMVPGLRATPLPLQLACDEYGFCAADGQLPGIVPAGTAKGPTDVATAVQDATGAAIKAIQWLHSTTSTPSTTI